MITYVFYAFMKKEKYMKSEVFGIFRVKVVTKYIGIGSLGTQKQASFTVWCLFLKKNTNFLNQTVILLILLILLVNIEFPFMGPWGPI